MLKTNARAGASFQYFDINQFTDHNGKLRWIAWYYSDIGSIGELDGTAEQLQG
ncbi:MAG TPA: hypothetical protein PK522_00925 [Nitrosomonas sp.]|nr:hypothetical protein [Nitrosomonas sp.]